MANGPVSLMAVYKETLSAHGVEVNIRSPYAPPIRKKLLNIQNEIKVLVIGDSYLVGLDWSAQPQS